MRGLDRPRAPRLAAIVGLLAAWGCGGALDDLPREPLSGTITLDGKPVANGSISFNPTAADQATQSGGVIKDGAYAIRRAEGLVPGPYLVSIRSSPAEAQLLASEAESGMPGHVPSQPKDPIPARYNAKSTLKAEVKADAPNTFNFELQSKPR